ncbi:hypothetical protein KZZ52_18710 [Dactylosporangium sp. AC04546]|uniref:hypothetical protein n=1 Tax=Dactylosporangium sp. AC04546 TaxID=2862460 RepID=UPI001EE05165|nr:hypothetical protein [Dactylosporangium sp. AC04546]WVK87335.1 hypothetical protein KZZ52_18710 [Dactylosporangium sp. AC04546]
MTDSINVQTAFLQRLNSFTDSTAEDQLGVSRVHSRGTLDLTHSGLGGTAQNAGFALGDHRDADFSHRVYQGVTRLAEGGGLALRRYVHGDDSASAKLTSHGYGTDGVINPAV